MNIKNNIKLFLNRFLIIVILGMFGNILYAAPNGLFPKPKEFKCGFDPKQVERNAIHTYMTYSEDYEVFKVGNASEGLRWFQNPLIVLLKRDDCSIAHVFNVEPAKEYYGNMYHDVFLNKQNGYIYLATKWDDNKPKKSEEDIRHDYIELYGYFNFERLLKRDYSAKRYDVQQPLGLATGYQKKIFLDEGKSMLFMFGMNDQAGPFYYYNIESLSYDGYYQADDEYFKRLDMGKFKDRSFDDRQKLFRYFTEKDGYQLSLYDFNIDGTFKEYIWKKNQAEFGRVTPEEYEKQYGIKIPSIPYHKLPSDDPIQGRLVFDEKSPVTEQKPIVSKTETVDIPKVQQVEQVEKVPAQPPKSATPKSAPVPEKTDNRLWYVVPGILVVLVVGGVLVRRRRR